MQSGHGPGPSPKPSIGPASRLRSGPQRSPDEYVLVGGGLQNALIALALLEQRPATRLTLIEREPSLGGNHTWCFHAGDVPVAARRWIESLVVRRWACHDVRFAGYQRRLNDEYGALTSARLHEVVSERLNAAPHARLVRGSVRTLSQREARLDDGTRYPAELVIDARGPAHGKHPTPLGYQKFLGLELQIAPHRAPAVPVLMDATVAQIDGFRFMYVLPWSAQRVLLEDTYYSPSPQLERAVLVGRILEYAQQQGWGVLRVLREEAGVLPIPGRLGSPEAAAGDAPCAGYAGGLFHPTTGYSFPVALRFALHVAGQPAAHALGPSYADWLARHRRQVRFALWLNRLMFGAFAPEQRCHALERFYRLPADTIRRFYALETTRLDRARILCGKPPSGFSLARLLAGGSPS